jgi:hypothetical protein
MDFSSFYDSPVLPKEGGSLEREKQAPKENPVGLKSHLNDFGSRRCIASPRKPESARPNSKCPSPCNMEQE